MQVVGIGADGWAGLADPARAALRDAEVVLGSGRQLASLPAEVGAERVAWPSPLLSALPGLLREQVHRRCVVLASGDPTLHGIASTIARLAPEIAMDVLPHPGSVSLACARMGWAQQDVDVLSLVGRPVEVLHPAVQPGRRLVVLAEGPHSPAQVAALLRARGFGPSPLTALSRLGADEEQQVTTSAAGWPAEGWPDGATPEPLTVVAVECRPGEGAVVLPRTPGLPDDAYEHDGQLTKRHVRAVTLAMLGPAPGELLWDVGGGAGSIGIEWMRHHPACRAIAVERDAARAERIGRNARALGVPGLRVVVGPAPAALAGLDAPDAVFVGGGATAPGLLDTCWEALSPGGRLVVNVTTLESEAVVVAARSRYGGDLTRLEVAQAAPIGRFTGWRSAMPVTQWVVHK